MSMAIDLYSYDFEKLTDEILEFYNTNNKQLVQNILLSCGNKIGDRYIILNQDLWEEYNCCENVVKVLGRIFGGDEVYGEVLNVFKDNITDKQELIKAKNIQQIEEIIGIKIPKCKD